MGTQVTNAFITQWSTEIFELFAQKQSKLRNATMNVFDVVGSTYVFHRIDNIVANTKVRDEDVVALNPTQDTRTAALVDAYAPIYIDVLDELKTNASVRAMYSTKSVQAINRYIDSVIITALGSVVVGAPTPIATTAGGLTFAKVLEALEGLNSVDAPEEDRIFVAGSSQWSDLLDETKFSSSDYQTNRALVSGDIDSAMGFNWIRSELLDLNTTVRDCYAYSKEAVGVAYGCDMKTNVDWIPEKVSHLCNSYISLGSTRIDDTGVILVQCDEA